LPNDCRQCEAASAKKEIPIKGMPVEKFKLEEATIADIHRALRARSLSCRELVQGYLDRVDAYDRKGPALNSIVGQPACPRRSGIDRRNAYDKKSSSRTLPKSLSVCRILPS